MRINYEKLKEINIESLNEKGDQLSCFWVIQMGIERFIQDDPLTEEHKALLIELGILEQSEEERNPIVKPHKFTTNG
jgi:hypothetical protein